MGTALNRTFNLIGPVCNFAAILAKLCRGGRFRSQRSSCGKCLGLSDLVIAHVRAGFFARFLAVESFSPRYQTSIPPPIFFEIIPLHIKNEFLILRVVFLS